MLCKYNNELTCHRAKLQWWFSRIPRDIESATTVSASHHDNTLMPWNPDGMHRPTTSLDGEGREPWSKEDRARGGNDPDRWGWKIRTSIRAMVWNWSWCWVNDWMANRREPVVFMRRESPKDVGRKIQGLLLTSIPPLKLRGKTIMLVSCVTKCWRFFFFFVIKGVF